VAATTTAFLRKSLDGITLPIGLVEIGSQRPSIARMYTGSRGPSMNNVVPVRESCGPN
jgi:hypothetical protein